MFQISQLETFKLPEFPCFSLSVFPFSFSFRKSEGQILMGAVWRGGGCPLCHHPPLIRPWVNPETSHTNEKFEKTSLDLKLLLLAVLKGIHKYYFSIGGSVPD